MKPLNLKMTAFGPYPETEVIDFENGLKDRKMFLIHGATGSGKTSILDGICFALYGELSTKSRSASSVRSDFADDNTVTSVEFTFEIDKNRYKIVRFPKQIKKKVRGSGDTEKEQQATIFDVNNPLEEKPLSDGINQVKDKITEIIGFTADQFRQVIILPQGEFKKVLEASTKERSDILADLFETVIFERFEKFVNDKTKDEKNAIENLNRAITEHYNANSVSNINELKINISENNDRLKKLEEELSIAAKILTSKKEQLKSIEENNKLINEFRNIEVDYNSLFSKSEYFNDLKVKYDNGLKLIALLPYEEQLVNQKNEISGLLKSIEKCDADLTSKKTTLNAIELELEQLGKKKNLIEEMRIRLEKIKSLVVKEKEFNVLSELFSTENKKLNDFDAHMCAINKKINDCKDEIEALIKKTNQSDKDGLIRKVYELENTEKENQNKIQILNESLKFESDLAKLEEEVSADKKIEEDSLKNLNQLEVKFSEKTDELLKQSASHLASLLTVGCPCPVCGSKEHPFPAIDVKSSDVDSEIKKISKNIKSVKDLLENSRAEITNKVIKIGTLKSDLEKNINLLSGNNEKNYYIMEEKRISNEIKLTKIEIDGLAKDHQMLDKKKVYFEELRTEREKALENINKLKIDIKGIESSLSEIKINFTNAGLDGKKISDEVSSLDKNIKEYEVTLDNLTKREKGLLNDCSILSGRADELKKNLDDKKVINSKDRALFVEKYKAIGFKTDAEYMSNKISSDDLNKYEMEIRSYYEELKLKEGLYNNLKERTKDKILIETTDLLNEINITESSITDKFEAKGSLNKTVSYQENEVVVLSELIKKADEAEKKWRITDNLAKIISGKSGKVPFKSYLLITILDEVLEMSNRRLKVMSKNRYIFVREDDNEGKGYKGLGISIFDIETGKNRPVTTLSGGEGFIASLSLAMGLADVIQAYCGGREMDTIFIDEGFGSLDPESLDKAIKTLIDINTTGRLVGIISHVEELKARFNDCRLEIKKTSNGSKAEFHVF